jgi:hypothetical protein
MSQSRGLSLSRLLLCAVPVLLLLVVAGAARAEEQASTASAPAPPIDPATSQPQTPLLVSHPATAADAAATAQPAKDNKRLMVLMLLGRAWSLGPFGRLGQ